MLSVQGKYGNAVIYTDNMEQAALAQVYELLNEEICQDAKIRIMPDTHAGAGCVIGMTMTIKDKVIPNFVGVDIGCGMECSLLEEKSLDLKKLDKIIREHIPSGQQVREKAHKYISEINLEDLKCKKYVSLSRAILSLGTLGGGNHFIEANASQDGNLYLVAHSGSRYLGKQAAEYYQDLAFENLNKKGREEIVQKLKSEGKHKEIQSILSRMPKKKIKKHMAYLEGSIFTDYIHDMKIVQAYAALNRKAIVDTIVKEMGLMVKQQFTTIHNYIDTDNMILRKGAISAKSGEKVLIPINMRDGSLIAIGKGNPEWNYSAPHGAGRLLSRKKAKESISLEEYIETMKDVYSTSVGLSTLDESPMAYKPMEEILTNIVDTVEVVEVIKPIYNFKAS